jgi:hypothetical protein
MDMTGYYDNAGGLADLLAGAPPSKPKAQAAALRTPKKESTSITNVVEPEDPLQGRITKLGAERDKLLAEQDAAYAKPDYSGYQQHAEQRQGEGQRALMLALAAQEAGQEFQPLQAHFLKRAASAREPMKMTGGVITDTGFVEDVGHGQELQAKRLDARLKQIDSLMQASITAQERSQLAREKIEAQRELRMLTAGMASANQQSMQQSRQLQNANALRDDFAKWTEKPREAQRAAQQVVSIIPNLNSMNAQQQMATVYGFMRMLDPGSVVRESEYAMAERGKGLIDAVANYPTQLMTGKRLTPQQVQNMQILAQEIAVTQEKMIKEKAQQFQQMGQQYGIPPHLITPGFAPTPGSPEQAAPQGAVRVRGAQPPAAAAPAEAGPPPGAVRMRQ